MDIDFHAHFDSGDPELVRKFVENCEKNNCRAAMSGGLHYGAHDYLPNDQVIDFCNQYKDVLIPMVKLDLWDKEVDLGELRRLADRGAKGVKCIYPYYAYDHDLYMPFYEECEKLGLPILFHTGNYRPNEEDKISRRPILTNMDPLRIDRPARAFQDLKIVIAHLGTTFWRIQAAELTKMHANVYADLGGCGSWQALSAEELMALFRPPVFLCRDFVKYFRKLVFGSDCYVTVPGVQTKGKLHYEQIISKLGLPEDARNDIMGTTVASWFK